MLDQQIQKLIEGEEEEELRSELKIALCIEKDAEKRFWERVKLWSSEGKNGETPVELGSIGVGKMQEIEDNGQRFTMLYVQDFIDLPAYNLFRQYSVSFIIEDIKKVLKNRFACLMVHSHPSGNLEFSPEDKALAFIVDEIAGRPLLHIVVNVKGEKNILHFLPCWNCPHSLFGKKVKEVKGRDGNNTP